MKTLRRLLKNGRLIVLSLLVTTCGTKLSAQTATNPVVSIITPANGAAFYTPTNILMVAATHGSFTNVEFFAGTTNLGRGIPITSPVYAIDYGLIWTNPPVGHFALTAVGTDSSDVSTTSAPVSITVLPGPPPKPLRIVSPVNGAVFFAPVDIPIFTYLNHSSNEIASIASVQLFDGTNSLGLSTPISTNIFLLIWSNAPVGGHVLKAGAVISIKNTALVFCITSDPVNITVLASPPPPTNRPPIVSIVATDPVAIEGTNCWVWPGETNSPPTWAAWPTAVWRFFTGCGPKTATFTVRRFGDTNDDLTVAYDIGGTASNGVDYVALPGSVIVPAGGRRAFITIVPIDDGPPDVKKTVILTLTASTNTPPDYLVGNPRRAAAIILDPGPSPVSGMLPGGCFHLVAPGPDAAWFYVQCSTDLVNWTSICTNQVIKGSIDFVDPDAANNPSRFYRAVPLANPPSE